MSRRIDFITGLSPEHQKRKSKRLSLCYAYPKLDDLDASSVVHPFYAHPRKQSNVQDAIDDGLYMSSDGPLTKSVVKPYQLNQKCIDMQMVPQRSKKLLEITVQDVKMDSEQSIVITAVYILYKEEVVCKITKPFNRKLYKLLINNVTESANNLSIRIQAKPNSFSNLPFSLPTCCVKDKTIRIDFSIISNHATHSGTLICIVSLSTTDVNQKNIATPSIIKSTNDPNDPQNSLAIFKTRKKLSQKYVRYFELIDPTLLIPTDELSSETRVGTRPNRMKLPQPVVLEQPSFSLWDLSLGNFFEARRPLRPSSEPHTHRVTARDEILSITILRGVAIPVREESATVQPLIQIQWGETIQSTTVADGIAPVWQQTVHFGMPNKVEAIIKLSLYDQHPLWGLQWLGEATIPLEFQENHGEIERWIGLSSLTSPVIHFGYTAASSVSSSHTRIYVLIKMDRLVEMEAGEKGSLDVLSQAIKRCLIQPYKIPGVDTCDDAANLVMLLTSLPVRYGPLSPRQALKLNKVDYYGRAALLATLLQGLGLEAFVVLGSAQARRWAAFVMTMSTEKEGIKLWDAENGDKYSLGDSRCSMIRVFRIINHQNIWKNLQKAAILTNIKFNLKVNKEWQMLGNNSAANAREVQVLEIPQEEQAGEVDLSIEIENNLKETLSTWRNQMGLTTVFNRHITSTLKGFLSKLSSDGQSVDKNDFRQLYRAYHVHGFVINLRHGPVSELIDLLVSTKIQDITGPIEFALAAQIQKYIGKTMSLWLAIAVLRMRD